MSVQTLACCSKENYILKILLKKAMVMKLYLAWNITVMWRFKFVLICDADFMRYTSEICNSSKYLPRERAIQAYVTTYKTKFHYVHFLYQKYIRLNFASISRHVFFFIQYFPSQDFFKKIFDLHTTSTKLYNSIQLFNGSAGNRSKYFSRGIGKDQSVLLPEVNDRGQ